MKPTCIRLQSVPVVILSCSIILLWHTNLVASFPISSSLTRLPYHSFTSKSTKTSHRHHSQLYNSLKPAAQPLLDCGKALARSGELLIDATSSPKLDIYGGGLSAAGANIRNAGDCIAQAAASCRFKTGAELVCDEMREGATCLIEAVDHLHKAVNDAQVDGMLDLKKCIENDLMPGIKGCGEKLEAAGAGIMRRETGVYIGEKLVGAGEDLGQLALGVQQIHPDLEEIRTSGQRMLYAAEKMKEAGNNLMGVEQQEKKGKSWLKG
mmetsp:Transcript_15696/g.29606  ORF Transcript_15696/g.29606 Transcript_15696/m.29606 type:complete len:266 (+) Transcript_15696:83-880(+)